MSEQLQTRVQDAVTELLTDLDKSVLRRVQGEMHHCAAACCDDKDGSMDEIQRCIGNCSSRLEGVQKYVQDEITDFQSRIERCVLKCQDDIKDNITGKTSEAEIQRFKLKFEDCANKCGEDHVALLGGVKKRMFYNITSPHS